MKTKKEVIPVQFFKTNYNQGVFNQGMEVELIDLGNNNYEMPNGTIIHIFKNIPYLRNIQANKDWFNKNIYHLVVCPPIY